MQMPGGRARQLTYHCTAPIDALSHQHITPGGLHVPTRCRLVRGKHGCPILPQREHSRLGVITALSLCACVAAVTANPMHTITLARRLHSCLAARQTAQAPSAGTLVALGSAVARVTQGTTALTRLSGARMRCASHRATAAPAVTTVAVAIAAVARLATSALQMVQVESVHASHSRRATRCSPHALVAARLANSAAPTASATLQRTLLPTSLFSSTRFNRRSTITSTSHLPPVHSSTAASVASTTAAYSASQQTLQTLAGPTTRPQTLHGNTPGYTSGELPSGRTRVSRVDAFKGSCITNQSPRLRSQELVPWPLPHGGCVALPTAQYRLPLDGRLRQEVVILH